VSYRLMSWNVHGLRGVDRRVDPDRIARVIDDVRPDVAGLQEVGAPAGEAAGAETAAETLARLTGLAAAFGRTMQHARGFAYGNAILSRHPIVATRTYDLSVPGREPRGCLRADVELPDARLHVFAAHLGLHWRERRRQVAALLSADILRDAALAHPLALVGDFNSLSNRSAVPRWLRRELSDCALEAGNEAPTFPSRFPLLRLDHAYVNAALRVVACEVVRSALARRASDHLPLLVELELTSAARRPPAPRPLEAPGVSTTVGAEPAQPPGSRSRPG
jgi:endonuclease/exonuclease/phosphatase family metal-dependent hydrolase